MSASQEERYHDGRDSYIPLTRREQRSMGTGASPAQNLAQSRHQKEKRDPMWQRKVMCAL